ncbi:MAG: Nitrilase/cyanide hydratase and apolipoprotein N-acyltransferase [Clostridia bacterium 62_21]|nr:MAG: Nitrilase/cyanide hydratase and apolipoprotein N-acyltransferase [Clostridia bacterium 62_21]
MPALRLAICQLRVEADKEENLARARRMILDAAGNGAGMVILPEMFNCPYEEDCFAPYAETYPEGPSFKMLSAAAAAGKVYLFGGSLPERDGEHLFNSCFVYGPDGQLLARHRKLHLFDVALDNLAFRESATFAAGDTPTVVNTPLGKVGVAICYDIRFPELARLMVLQGAEIFVFPAAFNTVTGPAHWELLLRARAVDNQVFVAGAAPAGNRHRRYETYGHSAVVDPWGRVIASAGAGETVLYVDLDLDLVRDVRRKLPLLTNRRTDLYG